MQRGRVFAGVALAAALMFPLAGCSGKVRLSMQKHCESVGGKWQQSDETCNAGGSSKQASQICTSNGGIYLPGGMCEYEGTK